MERKHLTDEKKKLYTVLFVAMIGGLIAGIVCSAIMLITTAAIMQDFSTQANDILQGLTVDCSEEFNPFAMVFKLGDVSYYCTVSIKGKGQDNLENPIGFSTVSEPFRNHQKRNSVSEIVEKP